MKRTLEVGFEGHTRSVTVDIPESEPEPWDAKAKLRTVGKKIPRVDGHMKVTGRAKYTFDVIVPGMLYAAVLRSPLPAARVKKLDLAKAERAEGVKAVLAVAKVGDKLVFAGQDVAAVAATRPELALDALRLIDVEYDAAQFVTETMSAAKPTAPVVHEGSVEERRTEGDEPGTGGGSSAKGNVRPQRPMTKGDVDRALKAAAVVHEATYVTQVQTHSALETHGIIVRWDDDKNITAWCSTQGIFSVRDELAEVFGLEPGNVEVITEYLGGGFGAKFGASAPGSRLGFIAGELAKKAKAPVKLMCNRHEEHVCTGNRPDAHQDVKLGADKKGKLVAISVAAHGSAGIGTGAGVGRNAFSIYTKVPNIHVAASDVFTNAGPGTAMRAPGHPQGAFALELAIDELAAKLGVDPLELRMQHDENPVRLHQWKLGKERFDWAKQRAESKRLREANARIRRGFGAAASIWGDFGRPGAAVATCVVRRDGTIVVKNGVQDIGGGITTVLAQIAAEVFHRPLATVKVKIGNSELGASVGSGGSQTTSSVTPAVRNACEQAKRQLAEVAAKQLGVAAKDVTWDDEGTAHGGGKSKSFAQVCKKIDGEELAATASRPPTYTGKPNPWFGDRAPEIAGVQFAEVEVDTWTGVVRAKRIVAVHDCGRVMNELTVRSQVNGGVIGGVSYALMEQRVMDNDMGRMLNPNFEQYKICGAADVPEIEVVLTEVYTGANNTGAAGIGEPATIPTAASIACAVFDALGQPVRSLPITPDRVLAALGKVPERTAK